MGEEARRRLGLIQRGELGRDAGGRAFGQEALRGQRAGGEDHADIPARDPCGQRQG